VKCASSALIASIEEGWIQRPKILMCNGAMLLLCWLVISIHFTANYLLWSGVEHPLPIVVEPIQNIEPCVGGDMS
jgi:hypothetical protein